MYLFWKLCQIWRSLELLCHGGTDCVHSKLSLIYNIPMDSYLLSVEDLCLGCRNRFDCNSSILCGFGLMRCLRFLLVGLRASLINNLYRRPHISNQHHLIIGSIKAQTLREDVRWHDISHLSDDFQNHYKCQKRYVYNRKNLIRISA